MIISQFDESDIETVINRANATEYGLCAGVFTNDINKVNTNWYAVMMYCIHNNNAVLVLVFIAVHEYWMYDVLVCCIHNHILYLW